MDKIQKLEIQNRTVDLRSFKAGDGANSNDMRLEGYASVFEKPTVLWECEGVEYKEVIDRNAFNGADFSLCCMKYNHNDSIPILARVRGGSLSTDIDDFGLKFNAKLFNTTVARDIYQIVQEGGLDKCSFAFTVSRHEYDSDTRTRRILEIDKVFDVSIVDVPAYDDTNVIAVRDFFKAEAEKSRSLENENTAEAETLKRKRAILKTYL